MPTARFERLDAWREAHRLSLDVSRLCRGLPSHERYELASQLRRAARSVPANLAEGVGAPSPAVFLRHIGIALGSLAEVDNHLICARDEGYLTPDACLGWRTRLWRVKGLVLMLGKSLRR